MVAGAVVRIAGCGRAWNNDTEPPASARQGMGPSAGRPGRCSSLSWARRVPPKEPTIARDIELISDGEGLAVFGDPAAIELFLSQEGLESQDLDSAGRLSSVLAAGSVAAQASSQMSASSGRWVKLTKQSATAMNKYGLRTSSKTGLSTGVLKGDKGQVAGFVEFARTPGAMLSNPAMLAGAAGIMAQLAMQQTMNEITAYLETIDEKVDDILRAQKDGVLARMIGAGSVLDEAMTLRKSRGRVDEVTWSKVQHVPATIAETQAYAVRQLNALADKLEDKTKMGDRAKTAKTAQVQVREWLAVLARCSQLQDGIAVLELDRVLDAAPDEVDGHRRGLREAREARLDLIQRTTTRLIDRMNAAAASANAKVLLHPSDAQVIVVANNQITSTVSDFHDLFGIATDHTEVEARRWTAAAKDARDKAAQTGGDGVDAARRLGMTAAGRAKAATGSVSGQLAHRALPGRRKIGRGGSDD